MEIDFSRDGEPVIDFESILPSTASDGSVDVVLCGVTLTIRQSSTLGGRVWAASLSLARRVEKGEIPRWLEREDGAEAEEEKEKEKRVHSRESPASGVGESWLKGARAIELGAGCAGLPSIALALTHGTRCVLAEHPEEAPLLRENIAAVQAQVKALALEGKVSRVAAEAIAAMGVVELDWNDHAGLASVVDAPAGTCASAGGADGGYDLVVFSDCAYATNHEPLLRAVVACCGPVGVVLAEESRRSEAVNEGFLRYFCDPTLFAVMPLDVGDSKTVETRVFLMRWQSESDARVARSAVASGTFVSAANKAGVVEFKEDGKRRKKVSKLAAAAVAPVLMTL